MEKYMVRRSIQDLNTHQILGYELIFQAGSDDFYDRAENAAEDAVYSFLVQNMGKMLENRPVFITFTPSLLFRNTPKMFEAEKLVIQIEENLIIHPLATPIIQKFRSDGYRFAINNFQLNPKFFALLEYADFIRVELTDEIRSSEKGKDSVDNVFRMAQGFQKKCILAGIATKEDMDLAQKLRADYVEGSFVSENSIRKMDKVEYLKGNFFQLVVEISKDEPDISALEEIISRDAGLTYTLLKMVNSTYFALRKKTASVRHALVTMGISRLREWVYMLSFNASDDDSMEEVLKLSFLRATFSSELAKRISSLNITPTEAYMMGMFSCMEMMVNASLAEILQELPVGDGIKEALLEKQGKAGALYRLILSYEKADWKESRSLAKELGLEDIDLVQLYVDCVNRVDQIWNALTSEFEESKKG